MILFLNYLFLSFSPCSLSSPRLPLFDWTKDCVLKLVENKIKLLLISRLIFSSSSTNRTKCFGATKGVCCCDQNVVLPPEECAVANRGVCCVPIRGMLCREQRRDLECCGPTRGMLCREKRKMLCVANSQCGGPQQEFSRFGRKVMRFRRELQRSGREFGPSRPAGLAGLPLKMIYQNNTFQISLYYIRDNY